MKNISFFIILISQYLFASTLLDVISHQGLFHGAVFLILSIILILAICLICNRKAKSHERRLWNIFRNVVPTAISIELIILFLLRIYIFKSI